MTYFQKSGNKYHAQSTEFDGQVYHSKLESAYAQELTLRQRAGDIESWDRQVKLDLKVGGYKCEKCGHQKDGVHHTNYFIDFIVHYPDGHREFVECKGMALPEWKAKWRLLEENFDTFKQHPDDCMLVVRQSSMRFYRK